MTVRCSSDTCTAELETRGGLTEDEWNDTGWVVRYVDGLLTFWCPSDADLAQVVVS